MFNIILAVDTQNGIGKDNKLPWHCATDLKHFKTTTKGHILIVGRKTWESMPQKHILKDRNVIVVSNTTKYTNVVTESTFSRALQIAYLHKFKDQEIFVIGGLQLYNEAFTHINLAYVYVTKIYGKYTCDTYIDKLEEYLKKFKLQNISKYDDCEIQTYITPPYS